MNAPDKKEELARRIRAQIAEDKRWGALSFGFAHTLAWIAVLSSFGSAIVAATGIVSPVLTAILASISGCIIVLARNLSFMPLSRWHHRLADRLEAVGRSMEFENKSVEEISIEFSKMMREFQNNSRSADLQSALE